MAGTAPALGLHPIRASITAQEVPIPLSALGLAAGVAAVGVLMLIAERLQPGRRWPHVPGYGAVLAFGPVLPESLRAPVMRFGVCADAPLLREIGIDPA